MAMAGRAFSTWVGRPGQRSRFMQACSLYVQGLAWGVDDIALKETFEEYGRVVDCKVMMNPTTGRSKGFGFVTFSTRDAAQEALEALDGKDMAGRTLRVDFARDEDKEQLKKSSSAYKNFLDILAQVPAAEGQKYLPAAEKQNHIATTEKPKSIPP